MRNTLYFNDAQWPLVVFEMPVRLTTVELFRYISELEGCLGQQEPFAMVIDLSATSLPDSTVRAELSGFYAENATEAAGLIVGEAIVTSSNPVIAWVDSLSCAAPPLHPRQAFALRADGLRWARRALRDAGVPGGEQRLRKSGIRYDGAEAPDAYIKIG